MRGLMKLGNVLKEAREKQGLVQADVAHELGYTTAQFVSNWERGLSYPPLKAIKPLAKMLKVNADELFETVLETIVAMEIEKCRSEWKKLRKM